MRTVCVFFGGLSLLLVGVSAIHFQETLTGYKNRDGFGFSANSLSIYSPVYHQGEPRIID